MGYLSSSSLEGRHAHPLLYFPTLSVADWTIESHDLGSEHSDWLNQLSRIPPALLQHTYSLWHSLSFQHNRHSAPELLQCLLVLTIINGFVWLCKCWQDLTHTSTILWWLSFAETVSDFPKSTLSHSWET